MKNTNTPKLEEHIENFCKDSYKNANEREFKGFLEVPYDPIYSYYANKSEDENKMYLPIVFFKRDTHLNGETGDLDWFISSKKKEINRNSVDNIYYLENDIKELFIPDINIETYSKDFPYIMYFEGCDDGHKYCRFRTEKEREEFFQECLKMNTAAEIFEVEKENLVFLTDN